MPPPALDKHLRLKKRVEQLPVQELIPELAVERLRRLLLQHGDGVVGCPPNSLREVINSNYWVYHTIRFITLSRGI